MPKPINKQQLLDEAQKKYEALERQFASLTPEEMVRKSSAPGPSRISWHTCWNGRRC